MLTTRRPILARFAELLLRAGGWLLKLFRRTEARRLAGALAAAAALKAALVASGVVPFNADEAVLALMARHILQGERPDFYYGQAYMGSLDAYLVAAAFRVLGEQVWVVRLVQGLLYLGVVWSAAALGKAALGSERGGVLAAWLLAVPPVNGTLYTTVSLGGYGEALLVGNGILLAALRIANSLEKGQSTPGRESRQRAGQARAWLAFGFLSGLGVWAFGLTLVYSLPALAYVGWIGWQARRLEKAGQAGENARVDALTAGNRHRRRRALGNASLAVFGAAAGAWPWWGRALRSGVEPLLGELGGQAIAGIEPYAYPGQVGAHLFNLVVLGLPAALGLRPPWEVRWLALPLMPLALAFWFAVLGRIARRLVETFREIARRNSVCRPRPTALLLGVMAAVAVGFVLTPFGADPSGRYFLPLAVPLALFAADAALALEARWGRWAFAPLAVLIAFHLWGTVECALRFPPGLTTQIDAHTNLDHRADGELISFLLERGERYGYATYWIAYPLAFESQEALIYVPRLPYHLDFRYTCRDDRYPPYDQLVAGAPRVAYLTANHPALDERLRGGFRAGGVSWQEASIGEYRVFYGLSRRVEPEEFGFSPSPCKRSAP